MKEKIISALFLVCAYSVQANAQAPNWNHDPYDYQYDMTAYISLSIDGQDVDDYSDVQIAAFCGNECRGIAEEKVSNDHKYVYLRIRSNKSEGEAITFQIYDAKSGKVAKSSNVVTFSSMITIGYPSSPYKIEAVNPYLVTFDIDGIEHTSTMFFGDPITAPTETYKEGYTFEKWIPEVDKTVPAHDVTYTATYSVNEYMLTFIVDGNIIYEEMVEYESKIIAPTAPTKEGYSFNGWDDVPDVMPAHDLEILGSYTVNTYKLTYTVDGKVYKKYDIPFETIITPEPAPEREGYTFSGWSGLPKVMPAYDVNVYGTLDVNSYILTFYIDGYIYISQAIEYGSIIEVPDPEIPADRQFNGWEEDIPETMPAHNLEIHGTTSEIGTGFAVINSDNADYVDVYDIRGVRLLHNVRMGEIFNWLNPGYYIIRYGCNMIKIRI